jgi:sulfoxide reductase heme-binding subunit YedZ
MLDDDRSAAPLPPPERPAYSRPASAGAPLPGPHLLPAGPGPLPAAGPRPLSGPGPLPGPRPLPVGARPPASGAARQPAQRAVAYRGLPRPVRIVGWAALAIGVGAIVGTTAPAALMRLGAVAALRPGLLDWYAVRALGFLAYIALACSVLYGLLLSTKILDAIAHRPVSFALHKDLSIVGLILISLHGLLLLGDASYPFSLRSILVPFASPYAPIPVGIGQLALYATAVVTASFYLRRRIGQQTWRLLHYSTFLAFLGGTVHGIFSGSDSGAAWAFWIYIAPTAMAVFLTTYRIVISLAARGHAAPGDEPRAAALLRGPLDRPGAAD